MRIALRRVRNVNKRGIFICGLEVRERRLGRAKQSEGGRLSNDWAHRYGQAVDYR